MKEYRIFVYNVNTWATWVLTKKFSCHDEAEKFCERRSGKMYSYSIMD